MKIETENIGDMTIVECDGRIASHGAASKLGEAVASQRDAKVIVLDLTELYVVAGDVLRMLVFLQHWAYNHSIQLKFFGPSQLVRDKLERAKLEIASIHEMMALPALAEEQEQTFKTAPAA